MRKTVKEIQQYHDQEEQKEEVSRRMELFAKATNAFQLLDLTQNESRTYSTFNKERLRSFMRNPFNNAANIRSLSRFLYRMSYPYRRLIHYNAEMVDLTAMSVIPQINFLEDPNAEDIQTNYYNTLYKIQQMDLASEILKMLIIAWREDAAYGYVYDDDETFYIHILDGDYCKISSVQGGKLNFAYDFSYFRNHATDLEYWDPEFNTKNNTYQSDTSQRWQELDPEKTICLKINMDDLTLSLPPFLSLFEQIIDLIDLQSLQNVKDELSIYKLLVARMETLTNSNMPDDFSVDPDTAIQYYNKFAASLPDCVAACISPLKIDSIEFKGNTTEDVDMISNSMKNLFRNSGGSQILNNENATGTTAFTALLKTDTAMALKPILPQIQTWMNYYLGVKLGENHALVKYLEVSYLTKAEKKKEVIESAQYGVPLKLTLAALDGFSPLETLSLQYLENDILDLHSNWVPLQSSYTQSGAESTTDTDPLTGGRPTQDELTDEGEATREGNKNDL